MGALNGFDAEVEDAGFGVGANCGVARVGKGTGLAIAETGDVVFIATEILFLGCSEDF